MLLRLAAAVGGLGPALLLVLVPNGPVTTALAVALGAIALAVVLRAAQRSLAATGIILAGAAAVVAPGARMLLPLTGLAAAPPTVHLQTESFPDPPPAYAEVEGWFRAEWTLDEYATPDGQRPNQADPAKAMLVPFVGTDGDVVRLRGAVVVARVAADTSTPTGMHMIFGRVGPLRAEVLDALVATVSPTGTATAPRGVLIDTLDAPRAAEATTRLALVVLLALAAAACLWIAARRESGAAR